ncbi:MAG: hypothetical protein N2745_05250 [Syntrophorhabdaceae bacterium]|nr:hypothetical protein [Syntrophorhabdaceae bacterium]
MEDDMKELDALLNYLINHNTEHADEIKDLAEKARAHGKVEVSESLIKGVEFLNMSNESLKKALELLRG